MENDINTKKGTKRQKKINFKKNIGRIIALIVIASMLFATSATLIIYLMYYMQ